MRRRALGAFLAVAIGLAIGRELEGVLAASFWFALSTTPLMACIPARSPRVIAALLWTSLALIATGWFTLRIHERTRPGPSFDQGVVEVEGVVLNAPRWREGDPVTSRASGWWRYDVALTARIVDPAHAEPVRGTVWVRQMDSSAPAIRPGSRVRLSGRFEAIDPPDNPGQSDLRLLAAQRGAIGSLFVRDSSLVREIAPPSGVSGRVRATVAWLRARAADAVHRAAGRDGEDEPRASRADAARVAQLQSLISGLLLGEYDPQERDVRNAFARQGLVHILSISGFHLTVLASLTLVLLRLLGDHGRLESLAMAILVGLFMLVVPAQSPILRSGALVIALLLVETTGRRYDRLTILIWIAIALLFWRPLDLWSIGYQLSAGLTAALLWKGEHFHHRLWSRWITPEIRGIRPVDTGVFGRLLSMIRASISTSLLCAILAAPVVGAHAGLVSTLGVLVGVVVTPVIVLALWIGYLALLVGMFVPAAAGASSSVLGALGEGAIRMVEFFDQLPMSAWQTPPIPWTWALAATIAGAWLVARPRSAAATLVTIAVLASWLAGAWAPRTLQDRVAAIVNPGPSVLLRVDAFSVGDASYLLVRAGDDAMIWDAGSPRQSGVLPPGVEWARAVGAWRVPTLVLTHADVDHYAAADTLVGPLNVEQIRISQAMRTQWDTAARAQARAEGVVPLATVMTRADAALTRNGGEWVVTGRGDEWTIGSASVRVLWPPTGFEPRERDGQDNDASLVALIEVRTHAGTRRVLLTGDMSDASLVTLRELDPALRADVMEAPHHGTTTPGVLAWIAEVDPRVVIQSAGPRKSADARLEHLRIGRTWHATGQCGHAWVEVLDDGTLRTGARRAPAK